MGCVEILQYNPSLVDGRPLLPSLPSHRTLSADTFFAAFPSHALRWYALDSALPRRWPSTAPFAASHHTLSADTFFATFPSYALRWYALDSALPRRWPSTAPFAAFPSYALRWYLKRVKVTPAVYPRSAISGKTADLSAQSHRRDGSEGLGHCLSRAPAPLVLP